MFFASQVRNAALNGAAVQARTYAADAKASPTEVSSILEQRIRGVQEESGLAETGRVLSVGYVEPGQTRVAGMRFFQWINLPRHNVERLPFRANTDQIS